MIFLFCIFLHLLMPYGIEQKYTQLVKIQSITAGGKSLIFDNMQESTVNDRISALVDYFKAGNKSAFAKDVGISNQSLGEILGGRKSAPSFAALQKLFTAFPEVRMEWVIFGKGAMLQEVAGVEQLPDGLSGDEEKLRKLIDNVIEDKIKNGDLRWYL